MGRANSRVSMARVSMGGFRVRFGSGLALFLVLMSPVNIYIFMRLVRSSQSFLGQVLRSRSQVKGHGRMMKNVRLSGEHYDIMTQFWLFAEFVVLKWSVRPRVTALQLLWSFQCAQSASNLVSNP